MGLGKFFGKIFLKDSGKAAATGGKAAKTLNKWAVLGLGVGALQIDAYVNDRTVVASGIRGAKKFLNVNDNESVATQIARDVVDGVTTEGEFDNTVSDVKNFISGDNGVSSEGTAGNSKSVLGGLFSGLTNGLKNMMSGLFGGVTSFLGNKGLPLVMLLPAMWLMFGRFGWVGKMGGLLLGAFAASSLLGNSQQQQVARQAVPRVGGGTAQERFNEEMKGQQAQVDNEDLYTIKR